MGRSAATLLRCRTGHGVTFRAKRLVASFPDTPWAMRSTRVMRRIGAAKEVALSKCFKP